MKRLSKKITAVLLSLLLIVPLNPLSALEPDTEQQAAQDIGNAIEPVEQEDLNGHTYYVYDSDLDWYAAKDFCEENGGHLATVTYQEEWDLICGMIEGHGAEFWLGANDDAEEGVWEWVTGEDFDYCVWGYGEPSNENNIENYLATNNASWNDRTCDVNEDAPVDGFIMEVEHTNDLAWYSWNGHLYCMVEVCGDEPMEWEELLEYCAGRGGHPLSIESKQENDAIVSFGRDFVVNCLGSEDENEWTVILGCTDRDEEGVWKWWDGRDVEYSNWAEYEPNNALENDPVNGEDYCEIYGADGLWNDVPLVNAHIFVLEFDEPLRLTNAVGRSGDCVDVTLIADSEVQLQAISLRYINYDGNAMTFDTNDMEIVDHGDDILNISQIDTGIMIVFDDCYTFEGEVIRFRLHIGDETPDGQYSFSAELGYSDENENIHKMNIDSSVKVKNYMTGDVSFDGMVSVSDAVCLLWWICGLRDIDMPEGIDLDFDNNGIVNASDAVQLLWHVFYPDEFRIDYDEFFVIAG